MPRGTILGIDVGTSACKSVAIDSEGRIQASSYFSYNLTSPRPGWFELDPCTITHACIISIREILRQIPAKSIESISIDGISNSPILIDRDFRPLRACILWLDRRGAEHISRILKILETENITPMLPITPLVTLVKLLWVKENEPDIWRNTYSILQPKDYVRMWLTNSVATDPSDASVTMMFDGEKFGWADYIELFNIELEKLPETVPSHNVIGYVTKKPAEITGLQEGTPVVTGCADGVADTLAAGLMREPDSLIRLGTAGVFSTISSKYVPGKDRYYIFAHAMPGKWIIQRMFPFGIPHKWFFDAFYGEDLERAKYMRLDPYTYIEDALLKKMDIVEDLIFIPNMNTLEDPSYFSGAFIGLKSVHMRSHLAIALFQGLTCAIKEALDIVSEKLEFTPVTLRLIGGGSRSTLVRKMIAALLNARIETIKYHDASIGAAILAGVGVGIYKSFEEAFKKIIKIDQVEEPDESLREKLLETYGKYLELRKLLMGRFTMPLAEQ